MTVVVFHGNCYDGFGAAWAASKFLGRSEHVKYISAAYDKGPPPEVFDAEQVYILDYCYKPDEMIAIAQKTKVLVLDHHHTAVQRMTGVTHPNLESMFDMERSGAGMAWDYFSRGTTRPELINHIEDRDLWKFKIPGSREVQASLISYPMDFTVWDSFNVAGLMSEGVALLRMNEQIVEKTCKSPWLINMAGHFIPVVNTSMAWSEVGEHLLEKHPNAPFVASFTEFGDTTMWSLRSREDFDCGEIAKQFGGGGHKQAAGFKIRRGQLLYDKLP